MKLVETNSGLGYGEYAYFVHIADNTYLCIFENDDRDNFWKMYSVGKTYDLEDYELDVVIPEKHQTVLKKSPLYDTFLFNNFLDTLKKIK